MVNWFTQTSGFMYKTTYISGDAYVINKLSQSTRSCNSQVIESTKEESSGPQGQYEVTESTSTLKCSESPDFGQFSVTSRNTARESSFRKKEKSHPHTDNKQGTAKMTAGITSIIIQLKKRIQLPQKIPSGKARKIRLLLKFGYVSRYYNRDTQKQHPNHARCLASAIQVQENMEPHK